MDLSLPLKIIKLAREIPKIPPPGSRNGKQPERVEHRFWRKVNISDPKECWPFNGIIQGSYGKFKANGRMIGAHVIAFMLARDCKKPLLYVCHSCDNPPCCNPAHLFEGSSQDNKMDSILKGRTIKLIPPVLLGARNPISKLDIQKVKMIRALRRSGWKLRELSSEFGVSISTIHSAFTGKNWSQDA